MEKKFAVIGLGRFGKALAKRLYESGQEILAIDHKIDKINEIADYVTDARAAELREPGIIDEIGVADYDTAIVSIGGDLTASIFITALLKEKGIKNVIAKAQDDTHRRILEKVGADLVIMPEESAGRKLADRLVAPNVFEEIDLSDEYSILDLEIPKSWLGKSLKDLKIRSTYDINVIAIRNSETNEIITISPGPDRKLRDNEVLIVIGENESLKKVLRIK